MATKIGQIAEMDRVGGKFVRLVLHNGQRVELPHALMDYVTQRYERAEVLVFVERRGRMFSYVQWVGTADEAFAAADAGILEQRDIEPLTLGGRR